MFVGDLLQTIHNKHMGKTIERESNGSYKTGLTLEPMRFFF
jgi:hypothetical protein